MSDHIKPPNKKAAENREPDYSRHATYIRIGKWFVFAVREHKSLIALVVILGLAFAFTLQTFGELNLPEGSN